MLLTRNKFLTMLALTAPLAAHATVPDSTFQFYFEGPLFDHVSSAPTYLAGDLGVTIRAFNGAGQQINVDQRWDGLGATSGFLEPGELNSSIFTPGDKGEYLTLTFNKAVQISGLRFSLWENGLFGAIDQAVLSWDGQTASLGTNNDHGLLIKSFAVDDVTGTTFKVQAVGDWSAFRLAGINAATLPIPEPSTYALMGLGLVGLGLLRRARRGQA